MDIHLSESVWQLSGASVRGKAHIDSGLANQDSLAIVTDASGDFACAVVSDGAGTAQRSEEGASETTRIVAKRLCMAAEQQSSAMDEQQVREEACAAIEEVRRQLALRGELSLFHCTLVAWLATPHGCFILQLGDSVAIASRFDAMQVSGDLSFDFFPPDLHLFFHAEHGEYSNETHFITESDWEQQLRVQQAPDDCDAFVLMTDGAMDVAMLRGEVFRGFLSNLLSKLMTTSGIVEREDVVREWLDDPQTFRVTGDDKTIFAAVRTSHLEVGRASLYTGQRGEPAPLAQWELGFSASPRPLAQPIRYKAIDAAVPVHERQQSPRPPPVPVPVPMPRPTSASPIRRWAIAGLSGACLVGSMYLVLPKQGPSPGLPRNVHTVAQYPVAESAPANTVRESEAAKDATQIAMAEAASRGVDNRGLQVYIDESLKQPRALVVSGGTVLNGGQAQVSLRALVTPQRLVKIRSEKPLVLVNSKAGCAAGVILRQGASCVLSVVVKRGQPGDEYTVTVTSEEESGAARSHTFVVFMWPEKDGAGPP